MTRLTNLTTILIAILSLITFGCSGSNSDPVSSDASLSKTSGSSFESEAPGFKGGPGLHALGPIGEVLQLSETQKEQIKAIVEQHRKTFRDQAFQHMKDMSVEERQAKRQEMRDNLREEIFTVLTPEQKVKAEALKAQLDSGQMPEELIDNRVERLRQQLGLTDDQVAQIKGLDTWDKLAQARPDGGHGREFRKQKRTVHEEHEKQMLNILTPEQQALFVEIQSQRRERMKGRYHRFGEERAQRRIEHLTDELGLNQAQQDQLENIFAELHSGFESEVKGRSGHRNRDEMRQAMRDKMSKVDEQIRAILTPEQLQKYEELKAEHGKMRGGRF